MNNIKLFQIEDECGGNWMLAHLGRDAETNKDYYLNTYYVHASELHNYSYGAKKDGLLIAKLLNLYHNGYIDKKLLKIKFK